MKYELVGRYRGDANRWVYSGVFSACEDGFECAYETAVEIMLGQYDAFGENEFDYVEICLGRRVVATVDESEVWA